MRASAATLERTEILVIGSGAGGAITAATLAEAGRDVLMVEEGARVDTGALATHGSEAMRCLYRHGGLSPILGRRFIAFAEGCCVGGSTEINSAFWHRPQPAAVERWATLYSVRDLDPESLDVMFAECERTLSPVRTPPNALPPGSRRFGEGLERTGRAAVETPRLQLGDPSASQFEPGAKNSMSRTYIPRALGAGARLLPNCRVTRLHRARGRFLHASAVLRDANGEPRHLRIEAEVVFVCGGAIQTPALLRRSGLRRNVGDSLRIQPMLKVAALFDEVLDSDRAVMPVYQLLDPSSGVFLGGSVFTPGFLGMLLSDRWPGNADALCHWRHIGIYYTACRGSARGSVRVFPGSGEAVARYSISREDQRNLSHGLVRLCEALFAGGSRRIYPGLSDWRPVDSPAEVQEFAERPIPLSRMALSTVHVSSSCPMGENEALCAVDSFGRLHGFENLHISDASIIPDAPGVNPQGTVMALALRNARRFLAEAR